MFVLNSSRIASREVDFPNVKENFQEKYKQFLSNLPKINENPQKTVLEKGNPA